MRSMLCQSVRVLSTLNRVCDALGVWFEDKNSCVEDKDKAAAVLSHVELMFAGYFDCHRMSDPLGSAKSGLPISDNYLADWREFIFQLNGFVLELRHFENIDGMRSLRFNMICPVMYLAMRFVDIKTVVVGSVWCRWSATLLIDGLEIRPCAIGWNFLELVILKINEAIRNIDESMLDMVGPPRRAVRLDVKLRIQLAGVCAAFVYSMLHGLDMPDAYSSAGEAYVSEWEFDRERRRLLDIALSRVSDCLPTPQQLNDYSEMSDAVRTKRDDVIRNMTLWRRADTRGTQPGKSITENSVSEMGLDTELLRVCKNGPAEPYRGNPSWLVLEPIERVFVKYFELCATKQSGVDSYPITNNYVYDWYGFLFQLKEFILGFRGCENIEHLDSVRFVAICPVMFLAMSFVDVHRKDVSNDRSIYSGVLMIDNLMIRPCAIGYNFLEGLFFDINSSLLCIGVRTYRDGSLRYKSFDVVLRVRSDDMSGAYVSSMLRSLNLEDEVNVLEERGVRQWSFDDNGRRKLDTALMRVSIEQPTAKELNDFQAMSGASRAKRDDVIGEMIIRRDRFGMVPKVELNTDDLMVYKDEVWMRYSDGISRH